MPEKKQSTISRLESKYSDVLGRRRRKEQNDQDDRDKTLEPDKSSFTPLTRSATTILSSGAISKKERTPYRLNRNYSDRKPIASTATSSSTSSATSSNYKPRSELSAAQQNASTTSSMAAPKTSNYYESPTIRHKDSLYDMYNSRLPASSRHHDYDHLGLSTSSGSSYGCYEGRDRDKENTFKSKYEPSRLYAELNNNSESFNRERNVPHYPKSYRRTATTNYRNYNDDLLDTPSTSSGYSSRNLSSASRYGPRKSTGYHRSQTQKFFDSEKSSVLRSVNDPNNNNYDDYLHDKDKMPAYGAYTTDEQIKSEAVKEREARRKEIQSLIAKYAQIDDVYLRAIDNEPTSTARNETDAARGSIFTDYIDQNSNHTTTTGLDVKTSDLLANNATTSAAAAAALGLSYPYARTPSNTTFLPLSKTQSASAMSSVNRSRIPKTFSSFVRDKFFLCLCVYVCALFNVFAARNKTIRFQCYEYVFFSFLRFPLINSLR